MLRAMLGGFLLVPIALIAVALLWSKAAVIVAIILLILFELLVLSIVAGGAIKAARTTDPAASPPYPGQENLASRSKWRREFMGWRYTPPPQDDRD